MKSSRGVAIVGAELSHVAIKRISGFGESWIIHAPEQVVRGYVQRIGEAPQRVEGRFAGPCPFRKSYPNVLVMQPGQDRNGDNGARSLGCSMKRRIFL